MIDGKPKLIKPTACIGHGECLRACPVNAITLVIGTEKRGVELPLLGNDFQTNVPGLYIAGELGGMGLIPKAAEQGRQAIEAIRKRPRGEHDHDVVIVGCGPAGLSAGLAAMEHGLRYKLLEQEASLGGAVFHYPRHKVAMTAPVKLALVGTVKFGEVPKE
jgi:thioredoxin reductase